jgi:hypothetical protein
MGKLIQSLPTVVNLFRTKKSNALYEVHIPLIITSRIFISGEGAGNRETDLDSSKSCRSI